MRIICMFLLSSIVLTAQERDNTDYELYELLFEKTFNKMEDTLVFNVKYVPNFEILKDLKKAGTISSKEKRIIELAFQDSIFIPNTELEKYFNHMSQNSPINKEENYFKHSFSKPIKLNEEKKIIFSTTSVVSKKYEGGKAVGCDRIIFFSKKNEKWSIVNEICYEIN